MRLNVQNETAQLQTVVLGRAESNGDNPTLDQTFDAKSYETVQNNDYPKEADLIEEMSEFEQVLKKYNVEVLRPTMIEDCNQVFSRDVGFVIEDQFFISNIIPDRLEELQAYREIKKQFKGNKTHCHSSERSIVHKYAIYFEKLIINELSNNCEYCVDVEYNQNIDRLKILTSRPNGAYPDMILHKRGTNDHNILVAEFKTWWNKDKWMWKDDKKIKYIDEDIKKIKNFLVIEKEKDSCNRNNNN